jgi:hypothetical protein
MGCSPRVWWCGASLDNLSDTLRVGREILEITDENRVVLQPYVEQFVRLANAMTQDGVPMAVVSSAFMTACATYSTFVVTGNDGALRETGVEKLRDIFATELTAIQRLKIEQATSEGAVVKEDAG